MLYAFFWVKKLQTPGYYPKESIQQTSYVFRHRDAIMILVMNCTLWSVFYCILLSEFVA